ncbi:MAG TPA: 2,3-bisphosphoglycerate-independent phosphoglycerate mutase [Desulfosporosinus sp.]|nr:2,3-bisphosphoglycerate-independent phosphoglycerate mutase [Desulfosporosinus sp.]
MWHERPLLLMILDGWGHRDAIDGNAIAQANLPNFRRLEETYPHTFLQASGEAVGLPAGQMGNSEVGHLNIGTGRVVYQQSTIISKAIKDGTFCKNPVLLEAMNNANLNNNAFHLVGLLSDGGVHSHITHLFALMEMAMKQGLEEVYIHVILDGRDVLPQSARLYINQLEQQIRNLGIGEIASVSGRYYVMDRDLRWDRIEKSYNALALGEGRCATSALAALESAYDVGVSDEFVLPTVIVNVAGEGVGIIQEGDTVLFFNFRSDRARQITHAFVDETVTAFFRPIHPHVHFVCMTQYEDTINAPVAFAGQNLENTLGNVLSQNGLKQLRIAETEKYAHVTYFFNGGIEEPDLGEKRILIPSPKVATYNLQPEMSAPKLTQILIEQLRRNIYDVIIINFANPDMVGHSGLLEATIKAVETVDGCLGEIVAELQKIQGILLVTADHGNAEAEVDLETELPLTAHSTNVVPFILVDDQFIGQRLREGGALCDVAPTLLELLNIPKPEEMTGNSLL